MCKSLCVSWAPRPSNAEADKHTWEKRKWSDFSEYQTVWIPSSTLERHKLFCVLFIHKDVCLRKRKNVHLWSNICYQFTPFNFQTTHMCNILTLRGFRLSGRRFFFLKKAIKIPSRCFGGAFARRCQVSERHPQPVIHTTVLLLCCNVIISSLSFISNF